MKVVVTGQVGLDKRAFLEAVVARAQEMGYPATLFNVGKRMYAEAPDAIPGKILDLPISRLDSLRRSIFKDILLESRDEPNVIVNTHATFRWNHGLFFAFDHDQMAQFDADIYIVLVDGIESIFARLQSDGHRQHDLKDLMVWREEEILATELLSRIVGGHGKFYIGVRGDGDLVETMARLIFKPEMKKCYLSFPMSHVMGLPDVRAEIDQFRAQLKRYMICFDPADMEHEKPMSIAAFAAALKGERTMTVNGAAGPVEMNVEEVIRITPDIDGQIYVRDFKLIEQSDMIISLVPELPDGTPALSSGVERELQHAHETTRDVFVIWKPTRDPSPFITETATRVFRSTEEAINYFVNNGYVTGTPSGSLFGG